MLPVEAVLLLMGLIQGTQENSNGEQQESSVNVTSQGEVVCHMFSEDKTGTNICL